MSEQRLKSDSWMPRHQTDAYLSQANPVSATLYTVLAETLNVRIISLDANITWAVTQPDPLRILVTVDGIAKQFNRSNPVSAQDYYGAILPYSTNETLLATTGGHDLDAFLLEGRVIKVEVSITWAVTQPTPLVCRVKWARC